MFCNMQPAARIAIAGTGGPLERFCPSATPSLCSSRAMNDPQNPGCWSFRCISVMVERHRVAGGDFGSVDASGVPTAPSATVPSCFGMPSVGVKRHRTGTFTPANAGSHQTTKIRSEFLSESFMSVSVLDLSLRTPSLSVAALLWHGSLWSFDRDLTKCRTR